MSNITDPTVPFSQTPDSHIRVIAQSDPVPNLTSRLGECAKVARERVASLEDACRELDTIYEQLANHHIEANVDLGPIGNAAAAARRDLEKERPGNTFSLPPARDPGMPRS